MNRTALTIAAIVALMWSASAAAQQAPRAGSAAAKAGKTPALQTKIERAWKDWVKKDRSQLESILADDVMEVWADGKGARDKKSTLAGMEAMNIAKYALSDFKITQLGDKAQLATYTATLEFKTDGAPQQFKLAVTEVWVKRGKEWKLLHYQESEVK
jgi:hypothetical protein